MKICLRLSIFWRIYLAVLFAITIGGSLKTVLLINQERSHQHEAINYTLQIATEVLKTSIINSAITEDFATIHAFLRQQVEMRPSLMTAQWYRQQTKLSAQSSPKTANYPAWFAYWVDFPACEATNSLDLEGVHYGVLTLTCDQTPLINEIWQSFVDQLKVIFAVATLILMVLLITLRSPLKAINRLVSASRSFMTDHQVRVKVGGSIEIRQLGQSFNAMADQISDSFKALQQLQVSAQEEAERHKMTLMSIADAVIITDANGLVTKLNPIAEALTGWSQPNAKGVALAEVLPIVREQSSQLGSNLDEFNQHESNQSVLALNEMDMTGEANEFILLKADGSRIPIEISVAAIEKTSQHKNSVVCVFRDISERKAAQENLTWHATHDALTNLPNRILLSDRLSQSLARSHRMQEMVAVALIDLDDFKPVNDRLGHAAGDELLQQVTSRMQLILRPTDTLARLGGDEFVLVLTDLTEQNEAEFILDRLLQRFLEPFDIAGEHITISASIGYTLTLLDDVDADTLLRHADEAMYAAKRAGRNRIHLFDVHHDLKQSQQSEREQALHSALDNNEFELFYQPKVDMRHAKIIGYEALARWRHPQNGILPPAEFLPDMEGDILSRKLGIYVMNSALAQMATWQQADRECAVAVNIAPQHFTSIYFIEDLKTALAAYPQVPPEQLTLEILESSAMGNLEQVSHVITACHQLGVKLAVDDFGVGYASLSYLRHLDVNALKIDQSFVRDLLDDPDDLALVEAVITLATLFGRQLVAEGVELTEQGVLLMRLGCDVAQGYGIAKPMPANEVIGWEDAWQPDSSWSLWADSQWEMSDFPLLVAQYDHIRWVKSVLRFLDGHRMTLSDEEVIDHHACRLGHWYDTHGQQRYGQLPAFIEMYPVHQQVHAIGRQIVELTTIGDIESAQAKAPQLLALKNQILSLLSRLQNEVAHQ